MDDDIELNHALDAKFFVIDIKGKIMCQEKYYNLLIFSKIRAKLFIEAFLNYSYIYKYCKNK